MLILRVAKQKLHQLETRCKFGVGNCSSSGHPKQDKSQSKDWLFLYTDKEDLDLCLMLQLL
jgi:hypothetical protein